MEESARNLTHFKEVEDGHGVLDAYNAWLKLKELNSERKIKVDIFNPQFRMDRDLCQGIPTSPTKSKIKE